MSFILIDIFYLLFSAFILLRNCIKNCEGNGENSTENIKC